MPKTKSQTTEAERAKKLARKDVPKSMRDLIDICSDECIIADNVSDESASDIPIDKSLPPSNDRSVKYAKLYK